MLAYLALLYFPFPVENKMADPVLNRLIQAVNSLRENNISNARGSQSDTSSSQENIQNYPGNSDHRESTESAINRLFPSTRGGSGTTHGAHGSSHSTSTSEAGQTGTSLFNVNNNYISKGRKRGSRSLRDVKGKMPVKKQGVNGKATLKDVILLPSPTLEEVPRGLLCEQLYQKGFAESAVQISDDMTEEDVKLKFNEIFKEKIEFFPEPKYEFARAIGNKIIHVKSDPFNGKLCKYLAKQGPVYIRSCAAIPIHDKVLRRLFTTDTDTDTDKG